MADDMTWEDAESLSRLPVDEGYDLLASMCRRLGYDPDRTYPVYVCDACGAITDAHGNPGGCVNTSCNQPLMRPTTVVEHMGEKTGEHIDG